MKLEINISVILTSIYGREESCCFTKNVQAGKSSYSLTPLKNSTNSSAAGDSLCSLLQ